LISLNGWIIEKQALVTEMNITILQPDDFKNWTAIPNRLILDELLKSDEVRLYCYLKSRPAGWSYSSKHLQKLFGWSRSKTSTVLGRLKTAGWIEISQNKSKSGKFENNVTCHLHTEPINTSVSPLLDFTVNGVLPSTEKTVQRFFRTHNKIDKPTKTDFINKTLSSESDFQKISFPEFRKLLAELKETFVFENGICGYLPTTEFTISATGYIHNQTIGKDISPEDAQKIWAYLFENKQKVFSYIQSKTKEATNND